jgi:hypothetical protein
MLFHEDATIGGSHQEMPLDQLPHEFGRQTDPQLPQFPFQFAVQLAALHGGHETFQPQNFLPIIII